MFRLLTILSTLLALNLAWGEDACQDLQVFMVKDSGQLATLMGRHKIFDIKMMMRYEDDQPLSRGEVVVVKSPRFRSAVLDKLDEVGGHKFIYRLPTGETLVIKIDGGRGQRSLAAYGVMSGGQIICKKQPK